MRTPTSLLARVAGLAVSEGPASSVAGARVELSVSVEWLFRVDVLASMFLFLLVMVAFSLGLVEEVK